MISKSAGHPPTDTFYGYYLRMKSYSAALKEHIARANITPKQKDMLADEVWKIDDWLRTAKKDITIEFVINEDTDL